MNTKYTNHILIVRAYCPNKTCSTKDLTLDTSTCVQSKNEVKSCKQWCDVPRSARAGPATGPGAPDCACASGEGDGHSATPAVASAKQLDPAAQAQAPAGTVEVDDEVAGTKAGNSAGHGHCAPPAITLARAQHSRCALNLRT